jgi:phosphohistidine phosphatase
VRTTQTAEHFLKAARIVTEIKYEPRIYEASSGELLAAISDCENSLECLLLVGHNPSIESLFNFLSQQNEPMPTSALACFNLETKSWKEVRPEIAKLEWYVTPKSLETI